MSHIVLIYIINYHNSLRAICHIDMIEMEEITSVSFDDVSAITAASAITVPCNGVSAITRDFGSSTRTSYSVTSIASLEGVVSSTAQPNRSWNLLTSATH